KDIFPSSFVEADNVHDRIDWTVKDSREKIDYQLPPLRTLGLNVSTRKVHTIPTFEDELNSVTLQIDGETLTLDSGSEADKIIQLVDLFQKMDPDVVLTEGGDSFIFPYLTRRAQHHGILNEMILGREETPLRVYEVQGHSYFSYGKILFKQTAARLLGRLHVDEANGFISSDCGLEGLFEVARTCIIPIQRTSRTTIGTSMTSLQLYHAVKADILIPWNKNEPEEWKNGNELIVADRGGFIYEPQFGLHESVGELDFSSLYPTIMRNMNLSGETVCCTCCPNSTRRVPELGWNICEQWTGIVPRSLDILLRKRLLYKKYKKDASDSSTRERYDRRQAALKWVLVCSFGYLGFKNARFGRIDAHIATCAFSRKIIREAVAIAESRGFKLVHGIVDSMWLKKTGAIPAEYETLCNEIETQLHFPIGFEGLYKWIVFLNSHTNLRIPVLNRYYGALKDRKLKLRGIDLRKHDTPNIVKRCQFDMLTLFAHANNSTEFRALIPEALTIVKSYVNLIRDRIVPIEELTIEKRLSKNPTEYRNMVPQAIAAQHLNREGMEVHAGQAVNYIVTRNKSPITQNRTLPVELASENDLVDSEWYTDLLLASTANLLLPFEYNPLILKKSILEAGDNASSQGTRSKQNVLVAEA
ncbi:MAG TPA: DNA polymerase domain-containing protein, partial [Candidatus Dormibacteraeota bacterium]|nr:DNA polymerase domain-containing protein [Candidatus Dormibacteraeota bacterium]